MFKNSSKTLGSFIMLFLAITAINIIASKFNARIDMTDEKLYTISDATENIIKKLKGNVDVKFYFSRSLKAVPTPLKSYATRVEEVLKEYEKKSDGKITVEIIDPKPDTDDEEWASKYGITPAKLPMGQEMFFGAVFLKGTNEVALPYFDANREQFLEYDISEALLATQTKSKPKIAVISSLPIFNDATVMRGAQSMPWAFISELQKMFSVNEISKENISIPEDTETLILYHPKDLSDEALFAIDQFVMTGGKLMVFVDPLSRVDFSLQQMANQGMPQQGMPVIASDLNKLFVAWGIKYEKGKLTGDESLATSINTGGAQITYPFFLNYMDQGISKESSITNQLKQVMFTEPGSFEVTNKDHQLLELITTTENAGTAEANMALYMGPENLARSFKTDGNKRVVAGIVTGKFKSAFPAGLLKEGDNKNSLPPIKEAKEDRTIVVVADSDFLHDSNSINRMRFGNQILMQPKNNNVAFAINAVDFLSGSSDLIAIRSMGKVRRPFTVIKDLQEQAQRKWKKVETDLNQKLTETRTKLNELQQQRTDGSQFQLSSDQREALKKFREEERQVRKKLREVRKNLREDINKLENKLIAANLMVMPLGIFAFGMTVFARRSRNSKRRRQQ